MTAQLEEIVNTRGTNFARFNEKERGVVAMSMSVAAAIKKVLDTPILTEEGKLTNESKSVHAEMEKYIETIEAVDA